jgi:putative N6-adenine-specific DNA methylase
MKKFFVGCNIGFENELFREIQEFWPYLIELDGQRHGTPLVGEPVMGGVELEAPLHLGLQINFFSKLANRVLLRIGEKKIRDFPALFNWLKKIKNDSLIIQFGSQKKWSFEISASQSRLNNEKRIEKVMSEIFPVSVEASQSIYCRVFDDQVTVSLDTTGDLLHRRTDKNVGVAPVRETIAAFCLRQLIQGTSSHELNQIDLIDPMCGSGTFLSEARNLWQPLVKNGLQFLQWPQCPKILKSALLLKNYSDFPRLFDQLQGLDIDSRIIEENRLRFPSGAEFQFHVADLFEDRPHAAAKRLWLVSNIPYGERIKLSHSVDEIFSKIIEVWQPERMGLLMSAQQFRGLSNRPDYQALSHQAFKNGGLEVVFAVWARGAPLKKG